MIIKLETNGKFTQNSHNKVQIMKNIFNFAFPLLLNTVLVSSFLTIDLIMVGKVGAYAISSVGLVKQPFLLMQLLMVTFSTSATTLIAQMRGAENRKIANEVLRQSLLLTFIISFILFIIGFIFAKQIVGFMGAKCDTLKPATIYFRILMCGFIPFSLGDCIISALLGAGSTKAILKTELLANIVNLLLDYLLIYGKCGFPEFGVAGAGIATALSYVTTFIVCICMMYGKKHYIYLTFKDKYIFNFQIVKRMLRIGIPEVGNRLSVRIGMLVMTRFVSALGTASFAAYQICFNIHNMALWSSRAVAGAAKSLAGQSLGANRKEIARKYISYSSCFAIGFTCLSGILIIVFRNHLFAFFIKDIDTITIGSEALIVIALFQPFQAACSVISGGLAGAGETRITAVTVAIGIVVLRPIAAIILTTVISTGFNGIWIAIGIDEIFRFTILYIYYKKKKWSEYEIE